MGPELLITRPTSQILSDSSNLSSADKKKNGRRNFHDVIRHLVLISLANFSQESLKNLTIYYSYLYDSLV